MIRISVGFDSREALAYHVFVQSILDSCTSPVAFTPLVLSSLSRYKEYHADGSNSFIYTRFLTPWLYNFDGWAIYADGDMVCLDDISELWSLRDESKALLVVKHNYLTKAETKYFGNKNENYPRKNWSSLILWNCKHRKNQRLTPNFVMKMSGAYLHRLSWLEDSEIGELPKEWNWLTTEYPNNDKAKLLHYTLGTPCFKDYKNSDMSEYWHTSFKNTIRGLD